MAPARSRSAVVATLAVTLVIAAAPPPSFAGRDGGTTQPAAARRDSVKDGALIGAAVGFAAGFLGLAAHNARVTASGPIWDGEALGVYTSAGLLGAVVGAGVGALIDAARPARRHGWTGAPPVDVVPLLGRRRGVLVSVRR
jgi:hypothetical protein